MFFFAYQAFKDYLKMSKGDSESTLCFVGIESKSIIWQPWQSWWMLQSFHLWTLDQWQDNKIKKNLSNKTIKTIFKLIQMVNMTLIQLKNYFLEQTFYVTKNICILSGHKSGHLFPMKRKKKAYDLRNKRERSYILGKVQ